MYIHQITSASVCIYIIIQSMQFPSIIIWYGAMWTVYRQNTNIVKNYVHASELRKCWHFYILKVWFLSWIFCRYFRYLVGTNDTRVGLQCTDKFPNVPTKLRKGIIGRGQLLPPPLPPLATLVSLIVLIYLSSKVLQHEFVNTSRVNHNTQ